MNFLSVEPGVVVYEYGMIALPPPLKQVDRTYVHFRGRQLSYFGGCDYFRLASHPAVLRAACEGVDQYGLNVAASRRTTGNHELYGRLEQRLARFFGAEAAVLVSNGYFSNLVVAQSLAGEFTHALVDARAHVSLRDAAALLACPVILFGHADAVDLARRLRRLSKSAKPLLLTDGMFSHDGSLAPLAAYLKLLPRGGRLLLDDAHGAGVLGRQGRGTLELAGLDHERVIQTMTLSKAFGVYGGAVLASRAVCGRILERSRIFTGNTPLPLPLVSAALRSLAILKQDQGMRGRLGRNTERVKSGVRAIGLPVADTPSPIIAVVPDHARRARRLTRSLLAAGIYPSFIHYPGGPESGYFRFALSSEHTAAQLDQLVKVLSGFGWRPKEG